MGLLYHSWALAQPFTFFMHENRTGPPMITAERDKRGQLKTRKKAPLPPSCHFPEFGRLRSSSPALFSLLVYTLPPELHFATQKRETILK